VLKGEPEEEEAAGPPALDGEPDQVAGP
jgi:hypothetical protein